MKDNPFEIYQKMEKKCIECGTTEMIMPAMSYMIGKPICLKCGGKAFGEALVENYAERLEKEEK